MPSAAAKRRKPRVAMFVVLPCFAPAELYTAYGRPGAAPRSTRATRQNFVVDERHEHDPTDPAPDPAPPALRRRRGDARHPARSAGNALLVDAAAHDGGDRKSVV